MILPREKFADYFNNSDGRLGSPDSPLWNPEQDREEYRSQWFVRVPPLHGDQWNDTRDEYWSWCEKNLKGYVMCYTSDIIGQEEWWGFTNKDDISLWILKWS